MTSHNEHEPRESALVNSGFDWKEFHPDACEDVHCDFPQPQGEEVQCTCYVDADHARD